MTTVGGSEEDDFDVAVIGAGPAGSCAAIAALRAGARTALIERAAFPRAKTCGCCLTRRAVGALDRLGVSSVLAGARALGRVEISHGARMLSLALGEGLAIGRDVLDLRLASIARELGCTHLEQTGARIEQDGAIRLESAGASRRIRARTTIVADGIAGTALDDREEFSWRVSSRSRMGFGAVVPEGSVECPDDGIGMHVARGGYIGVVRLPGGSIDVAAAVTPARLREDRDPASCAIAMLGAAVRSEDALRSARWRGTPLLTRRRRRIAAPGLLVAGDAAGYVEPFTGEGMTWAILTGAAAGTAAVRDRDAWRSWPAVHARITRGPRARCSLIALALRSPPLVRALLEIGRLAPAPLERIAAGIGGGRLA